MPEIRQEDDDLFKAKSDFTGLTPKRLQRLLIENGFDLGQTGADGHWGPDTMRACEAWFATGKDLLEE